MRILGADAFVGKDTAMAEIPVNYLRHGDVCITKIDDSDPMYQSALYFYEYITSDGSDEDLPFVVVPVDQLDTNQQTPSEVLGDDGGRWKLKNIYSNKLFAGEVITNTLTPRTSGGIISIGDDLIVGPNGITVKGQVDINSSQTEPPLLVNSTVMVDNLNTEYLGGKSYDNFLKNDNNQLFLPHGVREYVVYLTHPMADPPHYTVMIDMCNLVDPDPAIYGFIITDKQPDNFTVKFSGEIDSPNYTLHYFLIGSTDASINPPPASGAPPSGAPSGGPPSGGTESEYITASLYATPTTGNVPLTVNFDATASTSTGTITSYEWDFGDGGTDTGAVVDHEYLDAAVRTVTLTVHGSAGVSAVVTETITISI